MNVTHLAKVAKAHWAEWLPEMTAELKKEGTLAIEAQAAASAAAKEMRRLMENGMSEPEAEEQAMKTYILLPPEAGAEMDEESARELAEKEALYQQEMREVLGIMDAAEA